MEKFFKTYDKLTWKLFDEFGELEKIEGILDDEIVMKYAIDH